MKVLLYGINFSPELTGIGKYSGEMAIWLAAQGHEVRAVTAPPYYPQWQVAKEYTSKWYSRESNNGVAIVRCPLYVPAKPSGLKRIIHLATFAVTSLPIMIRQLFWRPDIVLVTEPPLFCTPTAWVIARIAGAKCCLHVQDFEVDAAFVLGIVPFAWLKHLVSWLECGIMQRFDSVSTISKAMCQRLHEKGIEHPVLFPNWADLSCMQYDHSASEAFRAKLGIGKEYCLCLYSGNIAIKQGLEILLEVANELPEYRFVICGDGAMREDLQQKANTQGLHNIIFLALQPLAKLPALLGSADLHLVIQKASAADLVMPSKLTNIFAVGGCAVVTAEPESELGQLADGEEACVYRCEPESKAQLVKAIVWLHKNKVVAEKISRKARAYANQHIAMDQVLGDLEYRLKEML